MATLIPKYTQVTTSNRTIAQKFAETISVKDFGAVGDGATNDATAIQAAIDYAATTSGFVTFPAGTYLINTALSLVGKYVSIIGAGQTRTTIKANATLTSVFDINETSDVIVSPFVIQDLKIDGNNTTTNGINVRYRHQSVVRNVYIVNCTNGMTEKDTWNNYRENVRIDSCGIGFNLVGSNHNSHWNRCTTTAFTTYGIKVQSLGTAADGNLALLFSACDVEFGTGGGVYFNGSSATFDTCYLGETVSSAIFTMVSGIVLIEGGLFFMGYTSNSIGFVLTDGSIEYRSGLIASQGALALSGVCSSTNGKIAFIQCNINQVTGGTQVSTGDILNNGPVATVYASRYGKNYTTATFNANATITTTTPANPIGKTLTVSSVTGASPAIVGFSIPLINTTEWQPNGKMYFVVVYSSNKAFRAKLSNGVWGTAPERTLGTLPSTSGVISTYLKMDATFDTNAYTTLEIFTDAPAATDTFTLYNVYLADQAFINTGANLTNMYKC
jgi:hypothetical protein